MMIDVLVPANQWGPAFCYEACGAVVLATVIATDGDRAYVRPAAGGLQTIWVRREHLRAAPPVYQP